MKRFFLIASLCFIFLLSGCSSSAPFTDEPFTSDPDIQTLTGWSFQYNEGTDDYSLFFGLLDQNRAAVSANVTIDIRIVNEENEEVFSGTRSVSENDFGYYTSQAAGEKYLANVRIPAEEITAGKSDSGKVYLTVYQGNTVLFDEVNCQALLCLPVQDIQVAFDPFPLNLTTQDYFGNTASVLQIQGAEYKFDPASSPFLSVTIFGEKISGSSRADYDTIDYKLYDSSGYLVSSGTIYLSALSPGDKFRDNSAQIYDVTPGESYTFQLTTHNYNYY